VPDQNHARGTRQVQLTDELPVGNYGWIKFDFQGLSVVGFPITHFSIRRVLSTILAAGVSNSCLEDALILRGGILFQEYVLDTPETTPSECGSLGSSMSTYITEGCSFIRTSYERYLPADNGAR